MSQLYFVILAKAGIQEGLRRFGSGFLLPCLPAPVPTEGGAGRNQPNSKSQTPSPPPSPHETVSQYEKSDILKEGRGGRVEKI
jgi:hypothetical protein